MARSHILSAIFLTLVSANVIQGGLLPAQWYHEENIPHLVNLASLPQIGELSNNFATSTANAASSALGGFRTYYDDLRTGFGKRFGNIEIPSRLGLWNRFVNGEIWPSRTIVDGTGVVTTGVSPSSGYLVAPSLLRNYGRQGYLGGQGGGAASAASSAAAAASAQP